MVKTSEGSARSEQRTGGDSRQDKGVQGAGILDQVRHSASPRLDSDFPQVPGEAFLHSVRQTPPFRTQGKPSWRPGILWNKLDSDRRVPTPPLPGARMLFSQ